MDTLHVVSPWLSSIQKASLQFGGAAKAISKKEMYVPGVFGLLIVLFVTAWAVYLAGNCNHSPNRLDGFPAPQPTVWKFLSILIALMFPIPYLVYYWIYHKLMGVKCSSYCTDHSLLHLPHLF